MQIINQRPDLISSDTIEQMVRFFHQIHRLPDDFTFILASQPPPDRSGAFGMCRLYQHPGMKNKQMQVIIYGYSPDEITRQLRYMFSDDFNYGLDYVIFHELRHAHQIDAKMMVVNPKDPAVTIWNGVEMPTRPPKGMNNVGWAKVSPWEIDAHRAGQAIATRWRQHIGVA